MLRVLPVLLLAALAFGGTKSPGWRHLSVKNGDISVPMPGKQQTGNAVFDIDKRRRQRLRHHRAHRKRPPSSGIAASRTAGSATCWKPGRSTSKPAHFADVDGDGDLDFVAGGEATNRTRSGGGKTPIRTIRPAWAGSATPSRTPAAPSTTTRCSATSTATAKTELVFWNQNARKLFLARIPPRIPRRRPLAPHPKSTATAWTANRRSAAWPTASRASTSTRAWPEADIDGDGKLDIVGGGRWFKHIAGGDASRQTSSMPGYQFSRAAAGQLIKGGRPEIVLVVGDGAGPLVLYEWVKGRWTPQATSGEGAERPQPRPGGFRRRRQPRYFLRGNAAERR